MEPKSVKPNNPLLNVSAWAALLTAPAALPQPTYAKPEPQDSFPTFVKSDRQESSQELGPKVWLSGDAIAKSLGIKNGTQGGVVVIDDFNLLPGNLPSHGRMVSNEILKYSGRLLGAYHIDIGRDNKRCLSKEALWNITTDHDSGIRTPTAVNISFATPVSYKELNSWVTFVTGKNLNINHSNLRDHLPTIQKSIERMARINPSGLAASIWEDKKPLDSILNRNIPVIISAGNVMPGQTSTSHLNGLTLLNSKLIVIDGSDSADQKHQHSYHNDLVDASRMFGVSQKFPEDIRVREAQGTSFSAPSAICEISNLRRLGFDVESINGILAARKENGKVALHDLTCRITTVIAAYDVDERAGFSNLSTTRRLKNSELAKVDQNFNAAIDLVGESWVPIARDTNRLIASAKLILSEQGVELSEAKGLYRQVANLANDLSNYNQCINDLKLMHDKGVKKTMPELRRIISSYSK